MSRSADEYYGFYRELRRVARKQHKCCACEIPIGPGDIYYFISAAFDGRIDDWKRCARCQFIHEQLRDICQRDESWPDETLNCGHIFEERWERPPPAWMAALAFWQPGDALPHLNPCTPSFHYDYDRAIRYRLPAWGRSEGRCQYRVRDWEDSRSYDNDAHANPCTEPCS